MPLGDGGADTYIARDKYHHQFAADLPAQQTALMAATQRPITEAALFEPSGDRPLWRSVPSWPPTHVPAGGRQRTVQIAGASHVAGVSHASETAQLVLEAASEHATAHT